MRNEADSPISSSRRMRAIAVAAVGALALMVPAAASASAGAGTPASDGSLYFARPSAKLVGHSALVSVRCAGSERALCSGTISLTVHGQKSESPFSVVGGGERTLAVSVDAGGDLSGAKALAVAKTAQDAGGFARSSEVLDLR